MSRERIQGKRLESCYACHTNLGVAVGLEALDSFADSVVECKLGVRCSGCLWCRGSSSPSMRIDHLD